MKPRVAFYTVEGSTLSWQRRLFDEGCDVLVYSKRFHNRSTGRGIVPLASSLEEWQAWGMTDPKTLWFFDCTDAGELADRLRSLGRLVVGGGSFMDRLEKDRPFGATFAAQCGIAQPPTKTFGSVSESIAFIKSNPRQELGDGGWAWKPNRDLGASTSFVGEPDEVLAFLERVILPKHGDRVSNIVQERIPGVALSTARWWNGRSFAGPYEGTLEHKRFLNDEKGPATGCSFNLLWFYRESQPKIAKRLGFEAMEALFRARNAPPGLYDVNAIVNRRGAWFLEWTPRLGIDSELCSQRGISNLTAFLFRLAHGQSVDDLFDLDQVYMDVRLSVPPYPIEHEKVAELKIPVGTPIRGADGIWQNYFVSVGVAAGPKGLEVADPFGMVGAVVTASDSVADGYARIYTYCEKLDHGIPGLQYRTDAAHVIAKDIECLENAGYGTTLVLDGESRAA